ncbi:hypothetical protein [Lutibacter sp.]|uniref:lysine 5,6-aminomutase reactivase ATPase KamC n=1 Tax=Lutibacter sp. TaxID=1925666 RepID=UPI00273335C9|nr:hypothetical protein [Lutibacter sp.]MDP3313702.1 hypothetical protein [Lutibacter sp.]
MLLKNALTKVPTLQFMIEDLDLKSSVGKRFLLDFPMLQTANAIEIELNLVEKVLESLVLKSTFYTKLQTKLSQLRDINGSIKNIGKNLVLDDIELFEIKHFAIIVQDIFNLQKEYQLQLIELPSLQEVIEILDPHQTNIPSFYIYDVYSDELAFIRKKIKTCKNTQYQIEEECLKELDSLFAQAEVLEVGVRSLLCEKLRISHKNLEIALNNLAHIDVVVAKANQAQKMNLCKPTFSDSSTKYISMFNPQIKQTLHLQQKKFQPVNIKLDKSVCFITGANMAGKTVVLKTVALCQYLYQFGFYIPAEIAEIAIVDKIMFLFEDEQSEGEGLSSFASEMLKVNVMVEEALKGTNVLILIDELARTTNPIEGKAIVNAVANIFFENNTRSLITTHYSGLSSHCRKLRVKGLDQAISLETFNNYNINNFIDYSIIDDGIGDTPHEALHICTILGINQEIISKAQNHLNN